MYNFEYHAKIFSISESIFWMIQKDGMRRRKNLPSGKMNNQVALPLLQKYIIVFARSRQFSSQTAQVLQMHSLLGFKSMHVAVPAEQ
jgi:hypothetical protein